MLEEKIINNLAQKIKISPDRLVAEAWEIILLKELFDSSFAKYLIFKGGTALRLAYDSSRFSEDLDFSLQKKISAKQFFAFFKELPKKYPEMSIVDLKVKYYTLFALVKIKETFLKLSFSIKIEISKRKIPIDYQSIPKMLFSPAFPLEILVNAPTLEQIKKDKIQAIETRTKPRDLFDLWYICEKLKEPMPKVKRKMDAQDIKQELHRFLPQNYHAIVSYLIQNYGKNNRKIRKNK